MELDFNPNSFMSLGKSLRLNFLIYKVEIILLTLLGCCQNEEDTCKVLISMPGTSALTSEQLMLNISI